MAFAAEDIAPGDIGQCIAKDWATSDDRKFHRYMSEISRHILARAGVFPNNIYHFLAVLHGDKTGRLYINNHLPVALMVRAKRDLAAGQAIGQEHMADITDIAFGDISLRPKDSIIYCFKVNWKFGLYFDITPQISGRNSQLDVRASCREIGWLYRRMMFESVYRVVESGNWFKRIIDDGWFPFVEILGHEFDELSETYWKKPKKQNIAAGETRGKRILDSFDEPRIAAVTGRWWSHPTYCAKRKILEAGVGAFLQGTEAGDILCLKTLLPEVEGILRLLHKDVKEADEKNIQELLVFLEESAASQGIQPDSLLIPAHFTSYLRKVTFRDFNVESGDVKMSRHTSAHGIAKPEDYTHAHALQTILVLDQLRFYL